MASRQLWWSDPAWGGKLGTLAGRVNVAAALLGALACASTYHEVPRDGVNDVFQYLGSATRGAWPLEMVDTNPARVWHTSVGRGTMGALAVGDRVTALATVDRWIYALDTRTGRVYWRYHGDAPYGVGPLMANGRVFAASEGPAGRLVAISLYSGKRRWSAEVGDVSTPLTLADGILYGANGSGTAFAYRADNGRRVWTHRVGTTQSGPLVNGPFVAFVTLADSLVVLDTAGHQLHRTALPVGTLAPLTRLDDSTAILASPDGAVLALALPAGAVRWRRETGGPVFGAAVVGRDTVYALTNACTLWSIPSSGDAGPAPERIGCVTKTAPVMVRDGVLIATAGGEVIYYDRVEHRRLWTRSAGGELREPPVVRSGQIIAAPILGRVVSFR
jgi:outer membrane protein assembly factor BamB